MKVLLKIFFSEFSNSIITLISLLGLIAIFPKNPVKEIQNYWQYIIFIIVIISFLYALYQSWKPNKIILKNNNNLNKLKLTIKYGDLFAQKGLIIIPVNEYFDIKVDDKIINKNTIHGKFINNFFSDKIDDLEIQLKRELKEISSTKNSNRKGGEKQNKYPIGTTIKIKSDKNEFLLIALTYFDKNNKASIGQNRFDSIDNYRKVFKELLNAISIYGAGKKVNIPLIGDGIGGYEINGQYLLQHILDLISLYCPLLNNRINDLNIILYGKDVNILNFRNFKI